MTGIMMPQIGIMVMDKLVDGAITDPDAFIAEVEAWCAESVRPRWKVVQIKAKSTQLDPMTDALGVYIINFIAYFEHEGDAIMFRLRWCGKPDRPSP